MGRIVSAGSSRNVSESRLPIDVIRAANPRENASKRGTKFDAMTWDNRENFPGEKLAVRPSRLTRSAAGRSGLYVTLKVDHPSI